MQFANLFENLSSSEWLLYISEWQHCNTTLSNIRVTTKVAVNALLSDNPSLQDRGSAIIHNMACKEVKTVVCIMGQRSLHFILFCLGFRLFFFSPNLFRTCRTWVCLPWVFDYFLQSQDGLILVSMLFLKKYREGFGSNFLFSLPRLLLLCPLMLIFFIEKDIKESWRGFRKCINIKESGECCLLGPSQR